MGIPFGDVKKVGRDSGEPWSLVRRSEGLWQGL